ncbi:hypothetical protein BD311DRAFT_786147 [Dichomitus squalens]|uniref:Uncharacterized protein n=1 Tax=Dichomitus squalens TaxID=114155 RepID=A0A4Q9MWW8_9APHY|nr:hypothetical protein BD311DRAFT_786147 [Dichomitus squalens]
MICRSCMSNVASSSSRTRALATTALRLAHTHALRHSSLLTHSRPSSRAPAHHHQQAGPSSQAREAFHTRSAAFSTTARRGADELPRENLQAIFEQKQRFLKLLQEKPEVEEHIRGFVQLLKDNGVDVSSGQMPSKLDMFRLMMKKEIRESATCMATTLQEAGIDLRNPEMMQSLMTMQSISKGNK